MPLLRLGWNHIGSLDLYLRTTAQLRFLLRADLSVFHFYFCLNVLLVFRLLTAAIESLGAVFLCLLPNKLSPIVFFEDVDDIFDLHELLNKFLMMRAALERISGADEFSHTVKDPKIPK